jgi:thioesterase domain-containing protein
LWGYANLARHLHPQQPIFGIQARHAAGTKDFATLEEMAVDYLKDIRSHQPEGPYYIGGYCFGGNVAYEIARQLRAQGQVAALVALFDCAPSNTGYERLRWWRPSFPFTFARNFYFWADDFFKLKRAEQRNLIGRKLRAFQRKLARIWRSRGGEDAVDLEEIIDVTQFPQQELELWQSHLNLLVAHVSRPYTGHVALFRTRGHPIFCSFERDFGWSELAQGGVAVKFVPGSHESIFAEPNVSSLAAALEPLLDPGAAGSERERPAQSPSHYENA